MLREIECIILGLITIVCLSSIGSASFAEPTPVLPNGSTVRVQSPELITGWHVGKLEITRERCAMVWISSSEVPSGRMGLGLMLLSKLERQEGSTWIDVPIKPLMEKEPKSCENVAG
jgi:hypothetical protein